MSTSERRVLFVAPYYIPFVGGATAFLSAMARRLAAENGQVTVLTSTAQCSHDFWRPPAEPPLPSHEVMDGVAVVRLRFSYPRPAPYAFGFLRRAGHLLHRCRLPASVQRPLLSRLAKAMPLLPGLEEVIGPLARSADVIQAADSSWDGLFTSAAHAARIAGRPFVAVPLMHLGSDSVRAHFQMIHQVDAYRDADAVLALSRREEDEYVRLGVPAGRVHRIAMGVEHPLVTGATIEAGALPEAGDAFRRQHGISGPIVAFLGANTYDKGAFTLALAAAQLAATGSPVTVVYAGSESEGLLHFLARQPAKIRSSLAGRVRVLGPVDETTKHQLLAACTVLALPSQVDTFGIVLLEAWSHGKPVTGARAGGIPDLVGNEVDGLLVPFGDVPGLAGAIGRLANDGELSARLGAAGQDRVRREFTWDQTYRTLMGVYDSVSREFQR